ncbi:MAG: hypothetical protein K6U80_19875 [Firmicutes bacterium]|nr:hypothetical protein [Bacillota bacterium]
MNIITLLYGKMYFWFIFTLIVYSVNWFILFYLCFRILHEEMPLKQMLVAILIVVMFVCARSYISASIFPMLLIGLWILLLWIFGRLRFLASVYSAVVTSLISLLGNTLIEFMLCYLDPKFVSFFFSTSLGNIVGAFTEVLFPLIALFVVSKFSLRLPIKKASAPYDLMDMAVIFTFGCMVYLISYGTSQVINAFQKDPQNISSSLKFSCAASFGAFGGTFIILWCMKKLHDIEIQRLTAERDRIESEKNSALEQLDNTLDLDTNLDPQMKQYMRDFFLKFAEAWATRPGNNPEKPFILNYTNLALYGLKELDGKILGYPVYTNQK